jgi:phosphoribosyl 1,2-cyclic phosphodiesterase
VLVLEANHDEAMLWNGPYPWSVKQRIASSHGHLSNRAAADLARELYHPALATIVLAHLSAHCNTGSLARTVIERVLARSSYSGNVTVAPQDKPLDAIDVMQLRRSRGIVEQLSLL